MNIIFLGPPGAGKGTVASRYANEYGIPQISTGDLIRGAIREGTELGLKVKEIVESGRLVPDDLTIALVKSRLSAPDTAKGFILDGFPRTIPQADALSKLTHIDAVVNFVLEREELIKRLSGRRVHKTSGRTYHVIFNPPKVADRDDVTGEPLWQRPDDEPEAITKRMEVYDEQTLPLIAYYKKQGLLRDLDARPDPEEVYANMTRLVRS